jgi:hypothetical protein
MLPDSRNPSKVDSSENPVQIEDEFARRTEKTPGTRTVAETHSQVSGRLSGIAPVKVLH